MLALERVRVPVAACRSEQAPVLALEQVPAEAEACRSERAAAAVYKQVLAQAAVQAWPAASCAASLSQD